MLFATDESVRGQASAVQLAVLDSSYVTGQVIHVNGGYVING